MLTSVRVNSEKSDEKKKISKLEANDGHEKIDLVITHPKKCDIKTQLRFNEIEYRVSFLSLLCLSLVSLLFQLLRYAQITRCFGRSFSLRLNHASDSFASSSRVS